MFVLSVSNLLLVHLFRWLEALDVLLSMVFGLLVGVQLNIYGEFDPGSGRTLAACLTHASRTMKPSLLGGLVANG